MKTIYKARIEIKTASGPSRKTFVFDSCQHRAAFIECAKVTHRATVLDTATDHVMRPGEALIELQREMEAGQRAAERPDEPDFYGELIEPPKGPIQ